MRILWVGNLPGRLGGQNRVTLNVVPELIKLGHTVYVAGKGTQVLDEGDKLPCKCFEFHEHEPDKLHSIIDEVKPEILLFSHDVWNYYFIPQLKQKYPNIKFVGWFTIDAHPIHVSWIPILRAMDYLCTPTQFGKDTVYQRWPEKAVEVIRYGVNSQLYAW